MSAFHNFSCRGLAVVLLCTIFQPCCKSVYCVGFIAFFSEAGHRIGSLLLFYWLSNVSPVRMFGFSLFDGVGHTPDYLCFRSSHRFLSM